MRRTIATTAAALLAGTMLLSEASADVELKLARFFGVCDDQTIPVKEARGEACIIQSIIRDFSQADNGITVTELPADWNSYYDAIKTMMVGGNPPHIIVMHKHRLPELAGIGALSEITADDYKEAGIDFADFTDNAIEGVTYKGKQYGVPFDFHAYLWHINLELFKKAGLMNADGSPKLPSSPEEFLEHARIMKAKAGVDYLTTNFSQVGPIMRVITALIMQQGVEPYTSDGPNFDSDAGRNALTLMKTLSDEGLVDVTVPRESYRAYFYGGNAAVIIDGTWRVDASDAVIGKEGVALKDYYVASHPTIYSEPAAWADTHMWAIPSAIKKNDPEAFKAAMKLLDHINDHNLDWARTGHLPVRKSVLASDELKKMSHRSEYASTAEIAHYLGGAKKYGAIQDAIGKNLMEFFLNDKPLDDTLADIDAAIDDALN